MLGNLILNVPRAKSFRHRCGWHNTGRPSWYIWIGNDECTDVRNLYVRLQNARWSLNSMILLAIRIALNRTYPYFYEHVYPSRRQFLNLFPLLLPKHHWTSWLILIDAASTLSHTHSLSLLTHSLDALIHHPFYSHLSLYLVFTHPLHSLSHSLSLTHLLTHSFTLNYYNNYTFVHWLPHLIYLRNIWVKARVSWSNIEISYSQLR